MTESGNSSAPKPTAKKTAAKKTASANAVKTPTKKGTSRTTAKKTAARPTASSTAAKKTTTKKTAPAMKSGAGTATKQTAAKEAPPNRKSTRLGAARERARSAPMSKYFGRSRTRAQKMLKDPEALKRIAEESYRSGAARSGPFADVMDDFRSCVRLVVAYARGNYREISADSLVLVVAGLIYVVSPIDLIPDAIPGAGFLDDAVVVGFVIKSVRDELDQFRAWELGQEPSAQGPC